MSETIGFQTIFDGTRTPAENEAAVRLWQEARAVIQSSVDQAIRRVLAPQPA